MKPGLTRVIRALYEGEPDPNQPWNTRRTRLGAVILYPPAVKRRLATVEAAKARAVRLARAVIQRELFRPPRLETLRCSTEVIEFDLRPFSQTGRRLRDGTKVWITEVERAPHGPSWPAHRTGSTRAAAGPAAALKHPRPEPQVSRHAQTTGRKR